MAADAKAWIVFMECGEYSDHQFNVLCVALSEADARVACEREARAAAAADDGRVARPLRLTDERGSLRGDGFWTFCARYEDAEHMVPVDVYTPMYGFAETTLVVSDVVGGK